MPSATSIRAGKRPRLHSRQGLHTDRGHRARVNTPSSPRLSKTHPGQGLGEVSSLLRRGRGAALTVSEVVLTPKHS